MGISEPAKPSPTTVADALFTRVQQRVLAVLFGSPDRSFYANEIIALAGSGTGAVQRELARLEASGLATVTRMGRQKHYQANAAAPVFAELRAIVLKTSGLADVLRAALASHAAAIRAGFVFGSVARGDDRSASDVDFMVVSDTLAYADVYEALAAAERAIGRRVNPTIYGSAELVRRLREDNAFVTRVLAQPKLWIFGTENDIPAR